MRFDPRASTRPWKIRGWKGLESWQKSKGCYNWPIQRLASLTLQATWNPYVAHVDEWLEEAAEPDNETDSWVARTLRYPSMVRSWHVWFEVQEICLAKLENPKVKHDESLSMLIWHEFTRTERELFDEWKTENPEEAQQGWFSWKSLSDGLRMGRLWLKLNFRINLLNRAWCIIWAVRKQWLFGSYTPGQTVYIFFLNTLRTLWECHGISFNQPVYLNGTSFFKYSPTTYRSNLAYLHLKKRQFQKFQILDFPKAEIKQPFESIWISMDNRRFLMNSFQTFPDSNHNRTLEALSLLATIQRKSLGSSFGRKILVVMTLMTYDSTCFWSISDRFSLIDLSWFLSTYQVEWCSKRIQPALLRPQQWYGICCRPLEFHSVEMRWDPLVVSPWSPKGGFGLRNHD